MREAALALGLSEEKAFWLIVLPGALRDAAPAILHAVAGLLRTASLVFVIGFLDPVTLMSMPRAEAAWNSAVWELAIATAIPFWLLSFAIASYGRQCERRFLTEGRAPSPITRMDE